MIKIKINVDRSAAAFDLHKSVNYYSALLWFRLSPWLK